jgi:uncharacterized protein (DUF2267 family)
MNGGYRGLPWRVERWGEAMAASGLEVFDRTVQKSTEWVNGVGRELGSDDRRYAYRVLRAYLHVLRDRLTISEAAHLASQLPHLLRGVYYDGWDPDKTPQTYRDRDTFLSRLAQEARLPGPPEAADAARAATEVLREHVSPGEVRDVLHVLPGPVRTLLEPSERR